MKYCIFLMLVLFVFVFVVFVQGIVKVGVLYLLIGMMVIFEFIVVNVIQFVVDEINVVGGVLGKKFVIVKEDGVFDWFIFVIKVEKLFIQDWVVVVFGGWMSVSCKVMLLVFEKNKGLLFYLVQFEGNECSFNIIYIGVQFNQ